jgi:hypothetical protein
MSAALCLAGLLAGCRGVSDREMLESKLRQQEDQLAEVSSQLQLAQSELAATQRTADALRRQLADRGRDVLAIEQEAVLHRAAEIRVQSWLSGGFERDGQPGDDGLRALVVPVDASGDTVKLSGAIDIELFDLSRSATEQLIAHRQFPPDQVAALWHRGMIGTGYLIELAWDRTPAKPELTLHVKLTAPDGREFHTTQPIKVLPPESNSEAGGASRSANRPVSFDTNATNVPSNVGRRLDKSPGSAPSPAKQPPTDKPVLHTSDRFTEETIPRLR